MRRDGYIGVSKTFLFDTNSSVRPKKTAEVNQDYLKELSGNTYLIKSGFIHMSGV
jgi:hypothetical protein